MLHALSSYLVSWYTLLVVLVVCGLYVPLRRLKLNRDIAFLGGRAPAVQGGFFGWYCTQSLPEKISPSSRSQLYMECRKVVSRLDGAGLLALDFL
jgi:hypothetical protein